jgi:hypothetical protein
MLVLGAVMDRVLVTQVVNGIVRGKIAVCGLELVSNPYRLEGI